MEADIQFKEPRHIPGLARGPHGSRDFDELPAQRFRRIDGRQLRGHRFDGGA